MMLLMLAVPAAPTLAPAVESDANWSGHFAPTGVAPTTGPVPMVTGLLSVGDRLLTGGRFAEAGGWPTPKLAVWDSIGGWSAPYPVVDASTGSWVGPMVMYNGELVVGGSFNWGGGRANIAR